MSQTTTYSVSPFENTNAAFHSGMPFAAFHKPSAVFQFFSWFGSIASLGQDHTLDTEFFRELLVGFRIQTSIGTGLLRRIVECGLMRFQAGFPLLLIRRIAFQDAVVTHQSAFHFIEPDLVSILHRMRFFSTANNPERHVLSRDEFALLTQSSKVPFCQS